MKTGSERTEHDPAPPPVRGPAPGATPRRGGGYARQAVRARTRPPHRHLDARAPRQAHCARGLRLATTCPRSPTRPRRSQGRGARVGAAAFSLIMPVTSGSSLVLVDPAVLLPPDDQGVPERRRRLHRHEGQLRTPARAGRRRRAAHRLRPHGRPSRSRPASRRSLGRPGALPVSRVALGRVHLAHRVGQPARRRESGRIFAAPTYFFIFMMFLLLGDRALPGVHGQPCTRCPSRRTSAAGHRRARRSSSSCTRSRQAAPAMTGVEAISNGVPAFKPAEWKNARTTLMWMGSLLGRDVPRALVPRAEAAGRARRGTQDRHLARSGVRCSAGRVRPRRCSCCSRSRRR